MVAGQSPGTADGGASNVIDVDHFPGLVALAFQDGARYGALSSEFALRYFDRMDAIFDARFRALEEERKRWRAVAFAKGRGYLRD